MAQIRLTAPLPKAPSFMVIEHLLGLRGLAGLNSGEAGEIAVQRPQFADSMLANQSGDMGVVSQVPSCLPFLDHSTEMP